MAVYINDISVIGPGLVEREEMHAILCGVKQWVDQDMGQLKPEMLPANERRRTTAVIKLALQCIQDLLRDQDDLNTVATVFASSDGDLDIVDKMCSALAHEKKIISPTLFHNSVHNAPAGYWSIAASMKGASTSLSAGDASFVCGLLEAVTQVEVDGGTVFFVAYDYPAPQRLNQYRHSDYPLAMAFRLSNIAEHKVLGTIKLEGPETGEEVSKCRNKSLEVLRQALPIGCGLPLVEALSRRARMDVVMPYLHDKVYRLTISH